MIAIHAVKTQASATGFRGIRLSGRRKIEKVQILGPKLTANFGAIVKARMAWNGAGPQEIGIPIGYISEIDFRNEVVDFLFEIEDATTAAAAGSGDEIVLMVEYE